MHENFMGKCTCILNWRGLVAVVQLVTPTVFRL